MTRGLDKSWFTEACEPCGSAFGLKLGRLLHAEQSAYQRIEIYTTEQFGHLMVIDGCVMLTDRDNFIYHEMMTHPALFTHPRPRRVAIIGGGDCGTLREVLKHPELESVVQVEIDERVTRLAEQYFPELCTGNGDPRAELLFGDGIAWMAAAPADSVDVVIVDSTDPVGPAEGLFGAPFYRDCRRALRTGGILVQQTESPLFHLESILLPTQAAMRTAGFDTTQTLFFPQCSYPSGWWTASLAYRDGVPPGFRDQDARMRPFATRYYNPAVHQAALAAPEFVLAALRETR